MKSLTLGKLFLAMLLFAFCFNNSSFGQAEKKLILNEDLDLSTRASIEQDGKIAAENFIAALLGNDLSTVNSYFPSKEVYKNMINGFGFKTEEGRIAALENLEVHYDYEKERVLRNFRELKEALDLKGQLSITKTHFSFKENVALPGGRAAVVLRQLTSNNTFTVYFYKFYRFNGKWYVTNKVKTDS